VRRVTQIDRNNIIIGNGTMVMFGSGTNMDGLVVDEDGCDDEQKHNLTEDERAMAIGLHILTGGSFEPVD